MDKQVGRLFNQAMDQLGESRHKAKEVAREIGVVGHTQMAKCTGIYSYGTSNTYLPYWKEISQWAKKNKGLKNIENISNRTVREYLQAKIRDCKKYSAFSKICSSITKFEAALNNYARGEKTGKAYDFQKVINNVRKVASGKLDKNLAARGFENSLLVVQEIEKPDHQLVAKVQAETGCRVHEASMIKEEQFRGLGRDPWNGKEVGVLSIRGKGGKERKVFVSTETYKELVNRVKEGNGDFKVDKVDYTRSVKVAAYRAEEKYSGTHDFRHTWAQDRFVELTEKGFSDQQALAGVSEEMGHVRPDITEIYLK